MTGCLIINVQIFNWIWIRLIKSTILTSLRSFQIRRMGENWGIMAKRCSSMKWKSENETQKNELENFDNLSVALLIPEIEDVKIFTDIFRGMGVIPHFYHDLKSFGRVFLEECLHLRSLMFAT